MTKNFKKFGFILSLALFAISGVIYAGTLTPSATPAATSYTLSDIYTRLTTNASATLGNHDFAPSGSPAESLYTLTQLYNAVPTIDATKIKLDTSYLGVAGSLVPNGGTATTAGVFNGLTAHLSGDWDLDIGTLDLACNTATFDATANLITTAYDGDGDGTNRWCMTSSGDAVAAQMKTGVIAWVDGVEVIGSGTQTLSSENVTVNAGYYEATTLNAVDLDLTAANILSGTTIFGVAGSASSGVSLANLFNGTSGVFTGGSQANGGADDYNNNAGEALGRYTSTWTACDVGNNYCGTGDDIADAKDENTGLIWSKPCSGVGCSTASETSGGLYTWDSSGVNNGSMTASQLCSQNLGTSHSAGWSLPHQKQLMQVYIDGSFLNLELNYRYHHSATTVSNTTTKAWRVNLADGSVTTSNKTDSSSIRCVR